MATSENSQGTLFDGMESELMSSAEASPARTFRMREREQVLAGNGRDYGASMPDLLASYDRNSSSWRTCQHCLVEGLESFSETWPRSGMIVAGTAFQLPALVPITDATDCGLWQTPVADDAVDRANGKWNSRGEPKLSAQVKMVPTPRANDAEKRGDFDHDNPRNGLAAFAKKYPTPLARDSRTIKGAARPAGSTGTEPLAVVIGLMEGTSTGKLNPIFVEWLMGFPFNHTECARSAIP